MKKPLVTKTEGNKMDRMKVLIVDDEPHVRLLVKRILGEDYIVFEASDGVEAIDIARTEFPDLVLMDIMMPGLDGYSACYQLKEDKATRAIPVIMLTGICHELNRKLGQQMGADGYITKPFDPEELLDVVNQHESPVACLAVC